MILELGRLLPIPEEFWGNGYHMYYLEITWSPLFRREIRAEIADIPEEKQTPIHTFHNYYTVMNTEVKCAN